MEQEQLSAWENLVRSVVGFPKYIVEWTVGLIVAILTYLHITTLAITAAVGGVYYHNALLGLFLFFILYSASRVAGVIANSIVPPQETIFSATPVEPVRSLGMRCPFPS